MRKRSKILAVLLIIFSAILIFSAYQAFSIIFETRQENQAFDELASFAAAQRDISLTIPVSEKETVSDASSEPVILPQYKALYESNPDLFGWIRIEDTKIDYPVMYTPEEPERYLHLSFNGSKSSSGVPFLDAACDPKGCHYLLHGHHMKSGSMFAAIMNYEKESFWSEHPLISFDTLYETGEYEILAAFYSQVYPQEKTGVFKYYQYPDLSGPERFAEYVSNVQAAALYDTGVTAQYGDTLLTLSTCSYHTTDGRFVVVARKIAE